MKSDERQWFDRLRGKKSTRTFDELLAAGVDINARDEHGRTALFYAVAPFGGDPHFVQWLVDQGADVTVVDHEGKSVLEHGRAAVSSAVESQMMQRIAKILTPDP